MALQPNNTRSLLGSRSYEDSGARLSSPTLTDPNSFADHQSLTELNATLGVKDQPQHTKLSLEDLPNEILLIIIRQVRHEEISAYEETRVLPSTSLLSLMQCSSFFHNLAIPVLYTHVIFQGNKHLPMFICRILARPDIARCLRTFKGELCEEDLEDDVSSDLDAEADMSQITDIDRVRISTAVNATGRSTQWIENIEDGQWDALIALFLSIVPNIKELILEGWWHRITRTSLLVTAMLGCTDDRQLQAKMSPSAMSSLRRVSLNSRSEGEEFELTNLTPFLRFTTLTSLEFHYMYHGMYQDMEEQAFRWSDLRSTLTVKELAFYSCAIHPNMMVPFLQSFPFLEDFFYTHDYAWKEEIRCFAPPLMMAGLSHLKSCLKKITLLNGPPKRGSNELCSYSIGSFADFEKLRYIYADASILLGDLGNTSDDLGVGGFKRRQKLIDAIPKTLQGLSLAKVDENLVPHILEFLCPRAPCSPDLNLYLGWNEAEVQPANLGIHPGTVKLSAGLKAAGVRLAVECTGPGEQSKCVRLSFRSISSGLESHTNHWFIYPHEGYDKFCEDHNYDPATGELRVQAPEGV